MSTEKSSTHLVFSPIAHPQLNSKKRYQSSKMKLWFLSLILLSVNASAATYYIDFSTGSDSNNGASKSTPWKHHPYMKGWAGSYGHSAGDKFIFKGGVVWNNSCFSLSISTGGSAGNSDYYGVDKTWYAGGSWTRPVFNGGSTTLASGVDTNIINMGASNVTIDNIEVTGLLVAGNSYGVGSIAGYISSAANILIENCYVHNWKAGPGVTADDARGGIVFTFPAMSNVVVDSCTISNIEQAAKQNGIAIRSVTTVSNCTIHDVSCAIVYAGQIFGNTIYNINTPVSSFDPTYHTNVAYIALWQGASTKITTPANCHDNIIHDINAGTQIYAEPCFGANNGTVNVYNNVLWNNNAGGTAAIQADPEQGVGAQGTVNVYNNTLVINSGMGIQAGINHSGTNNIAKMAVQNNQIITSATAMSLSSVTSLIQDHNLVQTLSVANGEGYTSSGNFAPTSKNGSTINAGTMISLLSSDLLGLARSLTAWDIGAYQYSGTSTSEPILPPTAATISVTTQ